MPTFAELKKAVPILFLSVYLLTTTELSQLLKLPAFITHFAEHKAQDKSLTIWQFLFIHYAQGDLRDADYEKDMKLPFKTHDNCNASIGVAVPAVATIFLEKPHYFVVINQQFFLTDDEFSSISFSNIWQPPKIS